MSGRAARYSDYRLPGGEDYREMLLTAPIPQAQLQVGEAQPPGKEYGNTEYVAMQNGQRIEGVIDYPFQIGDKDGHITYWPQTTTNRPGEVGPPKFVAKATR